jgi:hypothetical protein
MISPTPPLRHTVQVRPGLGLELREASSYLGPDHSSTLRARHSLGRWRGEAGDAQGAAETLAELVPHFLRVLGPDHPDTLRIVNALARWQERAMISDAPSA